MSGLLNGISAGWSRGTPARPGGGNNPLGLPPFFFFSNVQQIPASLVKSPSSALETSDTPLREPNATSGKETASAASDRVPPSVEKTVTTQKTGPKSTTPMFRAIKRIYNKIENHSFAGKRLEQSTKQNHNYAGKVNQDKRLQYQA